MLKLLLGVVVEVFVGVSLAGLILALAIPLLNRNDLQGANDRYNDDHYHRRARRRYRRRRLAAWQRDSPLCEAMRTEQSVVVSRHR